jgi:hypothetical protein
MDASPDLWTSAVNYWNSLREGTRDNTIGGLLVAVVLALLATGTLGQLGRLAENAGDKEEAARLYRESLGILERLGSPYAKLARRSLARVERWNFLRASVGWWRGH